MRKHSRIISALLAVCIVFGGLTLCIPRAAAVSVWDGTESSSFMSGSGTESNPYIIETARQLAYFAMRVNSGSSFDGKYIALNDDIVLNDTGSVSSWGSSAPAHAWTAIGTLDCPFSGVFDGRGHTVSGIYISSGSYQGLFGSVSGGSVKNVNVSSSYISGGSYVGGIVGRLYAESGETASITGCSSSAHVRGSGYTGGIAGLSYAYLSGSSASISCCSNSGSVTGSSYNTGGIAGRNMANPASADSSAFADISDCYNSGSVSGTDYVGGIAGQNSASAYSTASISKCYSVGRLSGSGSVGGIVGQNHATSTGTASLRSCYYIEGSADSGAVNAGGGGSEYMSYVSALSASALRSASSLSGFDFDSVWTFGGVSGYGYPTLRRAKITQQEPVDTGWKNPFSDVPDNAPYMDAVEAVVTSGLMNGTSSDTFSPSAGTTRGMIVTILWRMSGEPDAGRGHGFNDVAPGAYYGDAISWAAENDIVSGYGDGTFLPDNIISRQELAVIIYNYARSSGKNVSGGADISGYSDAGLVAQWAVPAVRWNVKAGIVSGTSDTTLSPDAPANRAQAAIIITRFAAADD